MKGSLLTSLNQSIRGTLVAPMSFTNSMPAGRLAQSLSVCIHSVILATSLPQQGCIPESLGAHKHTPGGAAHLEHRTGKTRTAKELNASRLYAITPAEAGDNREQHLPPG